MNTLSVRLTYRPLRIGWCIADGDLASFRKAVRLSFTMWGGRYNPIIPIGDPELADVLIRLFRADVLVNVDHSPEVSAFIDGYKHLPWPFVERELFLPSPSGGRRAVVADISHPISRIWYESYKQNPSPEPGLEIYEWDDADPLWDVFACSFGTLPPYAEVGIDYIGMARTTLLASPR